MVFHIDDRNTAAEDVNDVLWTLQLNARVDDFFQMQIPILSVNIIRIGFLNRFACQYIYLLLFLIIFCDICHHLTS